MIQQYASRVILSRKENKSKIAMIQLINILPSAFSSGLKASK